MKDRSPAKAVELAFSLLVCAFFGLAALLTALSPKATWSLFENRALAPLPALSREGVRDGSYFQELEKYLCDHAPWRDRALSLSALADLRLLRRPVVNDVVVGDSILLAYEEYESPDPQAMGDLALREAEALGRLARSVESWGGTFLYVAVPSHYAYFEDLYPRWLNNRAEYTRLSKELFFSALDKHGVRWLDVGEVWDREGAPPDFMSATDHHWTLSGCLPAYRAILDTLEAETDLELPSLTGDNSRTVTLPNRFLGSRGRKLLGLWESGERLTYLEPLEPIPFTRRDNGVEARPSVFSFPEDGLATVQYDFFMGGDIFETVIDTRRPRLPTLLIYGDSFTNLLETLLYWSFDTTCALDLRGYTAMSLTDRASELRPEIVICVRDYEQLLNLYGNGNVE